MLRNILRININNELDIVLAYKRAMQLSERLGVALANQTKFATAVSEICRNVVEYVGSGNIQFNYVEENGVNYLEAIISDRGRGIGNLDLILQQSERYGYGSSRGMGIINSKKLVDQFNIESEFEKGTRVTLRRKIPAQAAIVTKAILDQWALEFEQETDISPYAEIKKQNMQLLELLEQLRIRNLEAEQQLHEIKRLNSKLQQYNTEISELLEDRDKKNKLLQKINDNLDAFAHTVSHDLRSPLQNINGLTTALEACIESEHLKEANVLLPMLREQTFKMDRLITGILTYSLAGHHDIQRRYVDLPVLIHQVISSLQVPNNFKIEVQSDLPNLFTQEIYMQQVLANLIGNAIKYHDQPEQGVITIRYEKHPDRLLFTIEDNGPGILAEHQPLIFDMFERGQYSERLDSTGLGLSIVKKIVNEKGGNVWIESHGRGSKFLFTWPVEDLVSEEDK
ncbi:sensor histidine kinase [Pontibacter cellulosilyticus]|uniref:histidine kinase n=1 Tax=Pontibacter cellulosilyticus TaxID=1720253 RepID=A0A923SI60_9BACT|nr:ATP-binding protein [Pontibacter cellulosilyticus]MBC5992469.1 GHKL domain-containing protein [Pontibacter cellulosilyticus]